MIEESCRRDPSFAARMLFFAVLIAGSSPSVRGATFIRGDADGNGDRQITDAILVLNFLFTGGRAPVCSPVADVNADGQVNISDPVALLGHLFLGSPTPPDLTAEEQSECGGGDPEAIARGMKEFVTADRNGNLFACSTCHSMSSDETAGVLRAGHTLLNAHNRPNYKEEAIANYVGAVNVCREDWMAVVDPDHNFEFVPWTEQDSRFQDLLAFMKSLETSPTAPALEFEIVAPAKTGPATGNVAAGCALFNRSCIVCHGTNGEGTSLAPSLIDVTSLCTEKPDPCLNFFCEPAPESCLDNPDYTRSRIRLSGPNHPGQPYHVPDGFELAGTVMPFWSKDKLSDSEVEDLTSYVVETRQLIRAGMPFGCSDSPSPEGNVLRSGTLETRFHGVSGTVQELDTRKIRIQNFTYDGGGIEVRLWLYRAGNINGGRAIGPDIFGQAMRDTTFVVELPADVNSDSFDSVSVWCVSARQDFGHAPLSVP